MIHNKKLKREGFVLSLAIFFFVSAFLATTTQVDAAREGKIAGQYIVVLKDNVSDVDATAIDIETHHHGGHLGTYRSAFKGFSATLSDAEAEKVKGDPRVAFVSEDHIVSILDSDTKVGAAKKNANGDISIQAQTIPTGVRRIATSTAKGLGINVAIIDTGIDLTHPDLAGNILNGGVNCSNTRAKNAADDNGHGSHVSGTIAAIDNGIGVIGVAPRARLIPVKVLDKNGSGTWSSVICGLDWVTANASRYQIKLANMSLGGGGVSDNNCGLTNNDALHKAICRAVNAGVTIVVAAGNDGGLASTSVPAAYNDAVITVSALADSNGTAGGGGPATSYGADDTFASFSNYGAPVDIGAPGVNIYSTWKGGGYNTISGTSMATPHVVGAAALYLNLHPGSSWTAIRDGLIAAGEALGAGHTDPSGRHSEKVVRISSL